MDFSGVRRRLGAVAGELRRAILVRRRLLSAVCAAVAVLATVRAVAPPPPRTAAVLVAVRALAAGEVVGAADVASTALPVAVVPSDAAAAPVGRTLAGAVAPGEVVTEARLVGPSLLEGHDGLVAMPVRIADAAVVGLLRVGDRVDLFAADPAAATPSGVLVLQAGLVLALPRQTEAPTDGQRGRLLVLAVTADQGVEIAGRAARGLLTVALAR
ncbi:SAF domain-containing protein [Nocardioides jiangxiensis]|uniref:SAF domain-containing protein n=1 Tax=Nocardioides jiangxiensis TaxID=3064524 RepID=A0ABT9AZ40_9ACTN|nr:RcpC/CpaB family pilus assembly protein [Nocardioides sp. WY-20]MDO7867697.1 SAF domain-containing protein [Nocardioides sp. WY-20]